VQENDRNDFLARLLSNVTQLTDEELDELIKFSRRLAECREAWSKWAEDAETRWV
jgi:hypothetical protein